MFDQPAENQIRARDEISLDEIKEILDWAHRIDELAADAPDRCHVAEHDLRKTADKARQVFGTSRKLKRTYVHLFIKRDGGCTISDLCYHFRGMTRTQANDLVDELIAEGKVERRKLIRGRGRPTILILSIS